METSARDHETDDEIAETLVSFRKVRDDDSGSDSELLTIMPNAPHFPEGDGGDETTQLLDQDPIDQGKLGLDIILAYALPHFSLAAMYLPTHVHVNMFYTDVMLVSPGSLAFCTALARSFDILVDPFFGWLSDNTRSSFGRRKPYIAAALPISAVCYFLLFIPPKSLDPTGSATWFGIFYSLYLIVPLWLPLRALGPELTLRQDERVLMYAWTETFDRLGIITASVLPGLFMILFHNDYRQTYAALSLVIGLSALFTFSVMLFKVKEPVHPPQDNPTPLIPGVRRAFRNNPFIILLMNQIIATIAHTLSNVMFPFYLKYVLRPRDNQEEFWLSAVLLAYFGGGAVSIPFWEYSAKRWDKLSVWLVALFLTLPPTFLMFFLQPGDLGLFLALTTFSGISHGGSGYLYNAIQADAIDYDELRTGERREGQFIAFWALIPKVVSIASSSIPLLILQSAGYEANAQPQSDEVLMTMRLLTTLTPWILSSFAFLVAYRFPIHRGIALVITEEVQRRADTGRVDFQLQCDPLSDGTLALPAKVILESALDPEHWWFLDNFSTSEILSILHKKDNLAGFEQAIHELSTGIKLQFIGWFLLLMSAIPMVTVGGDVARVLGISLASGACTMCCAEMLRYYSIRDFDERIFHDLHRHKHEYFQIVQVF